MSSVSPKLDQALRDLLEAFVQLQEETEEKFGDDELSYAAAMVEAFEPAIENGIEDNDVSTTEMASLIEALTEALESLDPSAFQNDDDDDFGNYEIDAEDIDLDDDEDIDIDDDD